MPATSGKVCSITVILKLMLNMINPNIRKLVDRFHVLHSVAERREIYFEPVEVYFSRNDTFLTTKAGNVAM